MGISEINYCIRNLLGEDLGHSGTLDPRGQCEGGHALKWEAELASPNDDGFDLKWMWEAKSKPCAAGKVETKWGAKEANEDDNNSARKCVQIKEISTGCDVQIEVLGRKDEIVVMKYGISSAPVAK
ncbi:uncharacterized protein [Triticum aestivum]|uniref:uncharacterized protein n=1 Tax=Triticum aestivum TaxID=4565 RepID=UPI001D003E06|nr:uncharacterized protein LOC123093680 [Triticum aestivum]